MSLTKGLWVGFLDGIYNINDAKINPNCLSPIITRKMIRFYNNYEDSETILGFIEMILDGAAVINNFNECDFEEFAMALYRHCDKADCSSAKVISNMTSKIFQIIDKINSLAEVYVDQENQTDEQVRVVATGMGKNIGSLVRIALDIKMF